LWGYRIELEHFVVTGNHQSCANSFPQLRSFLNCEIARHTPRRVAPVNGQDGQVGVRVGVDEATVRRKLFIEYNIEIAGGLGELKGKIWRIGLIGYSSRKENVHLLLSALKNILK